MSWRSFVHSALSVKAKILLHHWSDVCGYVGGLHAHVTGEKLLWLPGFANRRNAQVRSSPFGQFQQLAPAVPRTFECLVRIGNGHSGSTLPC